MIPVLKHITNAFHLYNENRYGYSFVGIIMWIHVCGPFSDHPGLAVWQVGGQRDQCSGVQIHGFVHGPRIRNLKPLAAPN